VLGLWGFSSPNHGKGSLESAVSLCESKPHGSPNPLKPGLTRLKGLDGGAIESVHVHGGVLMAKAVDLGSDPSLEIKGLENRPTEHLHALWMRTFKRPLPPNPRREFLIGSLAYEFQARKQGGLGYRALRALGLIARDLAKGLQRQSESRAIRPGTRLLRTWQGDTHEVLALDKGFSYRGGTYSSLSEIARLITGARWSGPLFFGLKASRPKRSKAGSKGGA
jgi:Protein of unknown function (DUF2924)